MVQIPDTQIKAPSSFPLPMLLFTFSQLPTASSFLGIASSAWPSLLRLKTKCSNQLLSAVYSLMCLLLSTSVLGMRQVSQGLLSHRLREASPLLGSRWCQHTAWSCLAVAALNPLHVETQHCCEIQMTAVKCTASIVWSMAQAATKRSSVLDLPQLWSLLLHDGSATGAMHPRLQACCLCSKP